MDKATRKKGQKFKYSGNESQRVECEQKRELQKCNETLTPLAVTVTAIMLRWVNRSMWREQNVHKIQQMM